MVNYFLQETHTFLLFFDITYRSGSQVNLQYR